MSRAVSTLSVFCVDKTAIFLSRNVDTNNAIK